MTKTGLKTGLKTAVISLSIFAVASASTLGLTQVGTQFAQTQLVQTSAQDTPIYAHNHNEEYQDEDYDMELDYYLEDYKEGYRDGFTDGFKAALEELEAMYFETEYFEDEYFDDEFGEMGDDYWNENVELLESAPDGLNPSYLPEGFVFEDAYSFTDEDGLTDEGAFYFNEDTDRYLDLNRLNISVEEATELYGEDLMADLADLPTIDVAGTVVYMEKMTEDGEDYITAYFSKADGLYTIDSNLSETEMNVVLSSLLQ